jgi:hypothetical protein
MPPQSVAYTGQEVIGVNAFLRHQPVVLADSRAVYDTVFLSAPGTDQHSGEHGIFHQRRFPSKCLNESVGYRIFSGENSE